MAQSTCMHCGRTEFEVKDITPTTGGRRYRAVQCALWWGERPGRVRTLRRVPALHRAADGWPRAPAQGHHPQTEGLAIRCRPTRQRCRCGPRCVTALRLTPRWGHITVSMSQRRSQGGGCPRPAPRPSLLHAGVVPQSGGSCSNRWRHDASLTRIAAMGSASTADSARSAIGCSTQSGRRRTSAVPAARVRTTRPSGLCNAPLHDRNRSRAPCAASRSPPRARTQ
jgi:hypothetical protein